MSKKMRTGLVIVAMVLASLTAEGKVPVAYDEERAREICDDRPLDIVEGIWLYPDDGVKVMILEDETTSMRGLSSYVISVVATTDARLHPGEEIGKLYATTDEKIFKIELNTERHNELLLRPKSVLAKLSKEGDIFTIEKQKAPFRGRINFNFNRLLPGFWKIVSVGLSQNKTKVEAPTGMVKLYPSYDGNGSSRRKIRYL